MEPRTFKPWWRSRIIWVQFLDGAMSAAAVGLPAVRSLMPVPAWFMLSAFLSAVTAGLRFVTRDAILRSQANDQEIQAKQWFTSKLLWLNVADGLIKGAAALVPEWRTMLTPDQWLLLSMTINGLTVALRFVTTDPVTIGKIQQ